MYQPASHRRRSHRFLIHFLSTMNALFLARRIHPFLSLVEICVRLRRMTPQNRAYITHTKGSYFPSVSTLQGTAGYVNIPDHNGIRKIFPLTGGCSEALGAFRFFFIHTARASSLKSHGSPDQLHPVDTFMFYINLFLSRARLLYPKAIDSTRPLLSQVTPGRHAPSTNMYVCMYVCMYIY